MVISRNVGWPNLNLGGALTKSGCRQNGRYAYYMIALILRFCLPKGEEILHIRSFLCRKYLYESRFISLQMRRNRRFGAVLYPTSRSKELSHVPISIWKDGQQKAFFHADECMNFRTQTFATEVANVCIRGCKYLHPCGIQLYLVM